MRDRRTSKEMGMLLQDPTLRDDQGEYLHDDYDFSLDQDFLVGTGSSKLIVRDERRNGVSKFPGLDWGAPTVGLAYEHFNQRPYERPIRDNPQFHQVNVFAVAAHTLHRFEEALGRELTWRHGGPLVIRPHAMNEMNAYYDYISPSLNFGYYASSLRPETVWTCLSHDIVAHELGHAILDSFRPMFLFSYELDAHALHESMGDLLAIFSALEHKALVKRLYKESDCDMRDPSLISDVAEEFGIGLQGTGSAYLRSALQGIRYDRAPLEPHARSTVWTAAIYRILSKIVDALVSREIETGRTSFKEFEEAVVKATNLTRAMLIRALQYAPPTGVTMPVLARLIYEADKRLFPDDPEFRDIAKRVFKKRGLWDKNIVLDAPGVGRAFEGFETASAAALAQMVVKHADALRIPLSLGPRILILQPRLVEAERRISTNEGDERTPESRAVVERYLYFSYEFKDMMVVDGPNGPEPVPFVISCGGTLVMDEDFNDVVLVTDPPTLKEDRREDPARSSLARAADRFRTFNDGRLDIKNKAHAYGGSAFLLERPGSGAARLVLRPCNVAEHLRAINQPQGGFSFASRLDVDYSGVSGALDQRYVGIKNKAHLGEESSK